MWLGSGGWLKEKYCTTDALQPAWADGGHVRDATVPFIQHARATRACDAPRSAKRAPNHRFLRLQCRTRDRFVKVVKDLTQRKNLVGVFYGTEGYRFEPVGCTHKAINHKKLMAFFFCASCIQSLHRSRRIQFSLFSRLDTLPPPRLQQGSISSTETRMPEFSLPTFDASLLNLAIFFPTATHQTPSSKRRILSQNDLAPRPVLYLGR